MADYYIGANRGQTLADVAVNTSTNSKDLELHILTTNNPTKKDVQLFLEILEQYILGNGVANGQVGVDLPPN